MRESKQARIHVFVVQACIHKIDNAHAPMDWLGFIKNQEATVIPTILSLFSQAESEIQRQLK